MTGFLPPFPVAMPLAVASLLLATSRALPRRMPDLVAIAASLASCAACAAMVTPSLHGPVVAWFGGWTPHGDLALGVAFAVDPVGATIGAFIAFLFAATLVFAWGYFDEVHAHFHVLMLLFMGGMIGFCLTHDLFNMFVWFELMSIAAFALTAYELRSSAIAGALDFTVVNTIGSYLILGGIGLLYARIGALDFAALARGVASVGTDPVIDASFVLVATGFLIKAAQVPFHFWLSDAHAVAPSPVSVIFSGAMVSLGVFGIARVAWTIYAPSAPVADVIRDILIPAGAVSAALGGLMAVTQRHIKRLLAFSTISHVGIMLVGVSLLREDATAGAMLYLLGHGLVKAAMFMLAGIVLAICGGVDEFELRGSGRAIWPAGLAFALGALMLAGLPVGVMDGGLRRIDDAAHHAGQEWASFVCAAGAALTGAAVLRMAGRVFVGLGPTGGEEERSPSDEEHEKRDRPFALMMAPVVVLLVLALIGPERATTGMEHAVALFAHPPAVGPLRYPSFVPLPDADPRGESKPWLAAASVFASLAIAAFQLWQHRLPPVLVRGGGLALQPLFALLRVVHSGLIGDYVLWLVVGLTVFGAGFALL